MIHELRAVRVAQGTALTTHSLGDQKALSGGVERGRMELYVVQVAYPSSGGDGQRRPVTGHAGRVSGVRVQATESTRGEHDGAAPDLYPLAFVTGVHSGAAPGGVER